MVNLSQLDWPMEDWQMIFSGITIVSIWLFNPVEDLLMLCLEVLMCQYGFFIKQIAFEALYVCVYYMYMYVFFTCNVLILFRSHNSSLVRNTQRSIFLSIVRMGIIAQDIWLFIILCARIQLLSPRSVVYWSCDKHVNWFSNKHFLNIFFAFIILQAIKMFADARPPGIYKPDYIDALYTFYHEKKPEMVVCPSTPEWKRSSDLDLNGEAVPDDDDDGVSAAPLHVCIVLKV